MTRCLIFAASILMSFVMISSTSTASAAEWRHVAGAPMNALASTTQDNGGASSLSPWATAPTPGLIAFVSIRL